jgi:hypothetical protein
VAVPGGGLRGALEKLGFNQPVAAEAIFAGLREDLAWIATAVSPEQRQKLGGSPRATQKEVAQTRDLQVAGVPALRRGLDQDQRAAELDDMKRREAELSRMRRGPR